MNNDKFDSLMEDFNAAETDEERGYVAAQLYCLSHDASPAVLRELILEESDSCGAYNPEMDKGALRWIRDQLEPQS